MRIAAELLAAAGPDRSERLLIDRSVAAEESVEEPVFFFRNVVKRYNIGRDRGGVGGERFWRIDVLFLVHEPVVDGAGGEADRAVDVEAFGARRLARIYRDHVKALQTQRDLRLFRTRVALLIRLAGVNLAPPFHQQLDGRAIYRIARCRRVK